jgi:hypothetical protein
MAWTSIAVGRDSMALYDKGTGKLLLPGKVEVTGEDGSKQPD